MHGSRAMFRYKSIDNFWKIFHIQNRKIVSDFDSKPSNYVATPIFYVNASPHIGHLYTTVYSDALHRFAKLCHPNDSSLIFSTGTDEHGLKIQKSAEIHNVDIQQYCDRFSEQFRKLFRDSNVSYTHFIRTTDENHKNVVRNLWDVLWQKGFIYKSSYAGYYSINDECFVAENMITTNANGEKISLESGHKLEWLEEENYVFRLSQLQEKVVDWIENRLVMKPQNFHIALKADVSNLKTFRDISISRSKTRLRWGIEVPNDPSQVIYVWFDALVNYLTAAGYPNIRPWPPSHVIGKDIIKFHCIYWPAFLIAADLEPPRMIYCHSHWLYDKQKMSKSLGNVVDPFECIQNFTADGIRYFLLKEGTPHSDSNFNMNAVKIILNSDLADTMGNLLNRCTSTKLNRRQIFPRFSQTELLEILPEARDPIESVQNLPGECYEAYCNGSFHIGITAIMDRLRTINALFNQIRPWELIDSDPKRLECLLYLSLETIRVSAILLEPIVPQTSRSILNKLNCDTAIEWKSAVDAFRLLEQKTEMILPEKFIVFTKK